MGTDEWVYNFVGGGLDIVMASSKEEAIKKAKEEWSEFEDVIIDESSFRIPTVDEYIQLIRDLLE